MNSAAVLPGARKPLAPKFRSFGSHGDGSRIHRDRTPARGSWLCSSPAVPRRDAGNADGKTRRAERGLRRLPGKRRRRVNTEGYATRHHVDHDARVDGRRRSPADASSGKSCRIPTIILRFSSSSVFLGLLAVGTLRCSIVPRARARADSEVSRGSLRGFLISLAVRFEGDPN